MAKVTVSRQEVDEDNQLHWVEQEIEESELLPGEAPLPELLVWVPPEGVIVNETSE